MGKRVYETRAWRAVRSHVLARDMHRCQILGPRCSLVATEVDHIIPLADGGAAYDPKNLRAACKRCNGRLAAEMTQRRRSTPPNRRRW